MENDVKVPTTPATPAEDAQTDRKLQLMIIGGGILLLVLLITAIVLMAKFPGATIIIRDIAIVFVAVETLFIGIAIIFLMLQVQLLIKVLREEIQPLLQSVNETASTVRGTTNFMSENLVSPIIKAAGFSAGVGRVASDLFGVLRGVKPPKSAHTQSSSVQSPVQPKED